MDAAAVSRALTLPPWYDDWVRGEPKNDPTAIAWLRSRPSSMRALMRAYPPSAVVRGRPDGRYFVVACGYANGVDVGVRPDPHGEVFLVANVVHLELIAYHRGMTPEWLAGIIGGPN